MNPEPEIKTEVKEETLEPIEMVSCDNMDVDAVSVKTTVNDEVDNLDITDVHSELDFVPDIIESCDKDLLVYTTRLDDMQIWWNNLNTMYLNEVTQSIIKESKPQYTGNLENTKHNEQQRRTFSSLVEKIDEINCLPNQPKIISVQSENDTIQLSERSKALLRQCKPLAITLQDCMINKEGVRYEEPLYDKENLNHSIELDADDIKFTPKVEYDISDNIPLYMLKNKNSYVTFRDMISKDSVVYLISNDLNPTECYKLNNNNKQKHYIDEESTVPVMEIDTCCWYKREQRIKELSTTINCRSKFMRTQHTCKPGMCKCCCKKLPNDPRVTSLSYSPPPIRIRKRAKTAYYDSSQNSTWQNYLINGIDVGHDSPKWIDKALKYKTKPRQKQCKKYLKTYDTVLEIEHVYFSGSHSSYYYIEPGGLSTWIELAGSLDLTIRSAHLYITTSAPRTSYNACCWCRYNMILSELMKSVQPSIVKFMKKSHKCVPRKCVCCCKLKTVPTDNLPFKLIPISFPTQLKHNSCSSNASQNRNNVLSVTSPVVPKTNSGIITVNNKDGPLLTKPPLLPLSKPAPPQPSPPPPTPASSKTNSRNVTTNVKIINESLADLPPAVQKTNNCNMTTNIRIINESLAELPAAVQKTNSHSVTPATNNVRDLPKTTPVGPQTSSQKKPSDYILNRVLSKLQGLSIVIHCDNTVTADLSHTAESLSTESLKILKLLLQHADAYMKKNNFTSTEPLRIPNIFSSARKKFGVVEFPTIVLDDDDDDDTPISGDASGSSTGSKLNSAPKTTQISQTVPSQETTTRSPLPTVSNVTQYQDEFMKNISMGSESTSPPPPLIEPSNYYERCANILYRKRLQYYNSFLSLIDSGNENISSALNLQPNVDNTSEDLASCIIELNSDTTPKNTIDIDVGQKRKALDDMKEGTTEKKNKIDSNVAVVPPDIVSQLPFSPITVPSGVPVAVNREKQTNANIPLLNNGENDRTTKNATESTRSPLICTESLSDSSTESLPDSVQNIDAIGDSTPIEAQAQTVKGSGEILKEKNRLLTRLLSSKSDSHISEPRLISVESDNDIITGIITKEVADEDMSILGV